MLSRHIVFLVAITITCIIALYNKAALIPKARSWVPSTCSTSQRQAHLNSQGGKSSSKSEDATGADENTKWSLSPEVQNYFDQVFSVNTPAPYDFPALQQQCSHTKWPEDNVYLQCGGMAAGLTTMMSQLKVCLKMAVEAGTGIILPSIPLRSPTNLQEFDFFNNEDYMPYDEWFDTTHLITSLEKACPRMKILHAEDLNGTVSVKNRWHIDLERSILDYRKFTSYFWTGRPFKEFFEREYNMLEDLASKAPDRDDSLRGITAILIDSEFLLFRITDDPTGQDLRLWNDLAHLFRFKEGPRHVIKMLSEKLAKLKREVYGVHLRVEPDNIWTSLDNQIGADLGAVEKAWGLYGHANAERPIIYVACGDESQGKKFVEAGKERGWDVTHKWDLAHGDKKILEGIEDLALDFQGAVDMGIVLKSQFFLGVIGSAFSSTVGNMRDRTGRYRGSSFLVKDDGGARTHLFNEGDASAYACCL